jgi:hypothetical protein
MCREKIKDHYARFFLNRRLWILIPLASFLIAIGPYWIINILHADVFDGPWWRVPVMPRGVFDSYVYLNWMGATALGLPVGVLLKWYAAVIRAAWMYVSPWGSVPEVWITTRWISLMAMLIIGQWSLRTWAGLDRKTAWSILLPFWFAVALSIGLRPGAYSWYLPFTLFSFAAATKALSSLSTSRIIFASLWSLSSIGAAWLYPWNFMFVGLFLASIWTVFLILKNSKIFYALTALAAGVVSFSAISLAHRLLDPKWDGILGVYERSGIVFARVPFFANTVLAFGGWIILLFLIARASGALLFTDRPVRDLWAWLTLALLWFQTPFTGLHLYSDHLIAVTIVLAWYSFATVLRILRERPSREIFASLPSPFRWCLPIIAVGSTLFVLYIVQQPLRFSPFKFDSYAVHIVHWLALAAASWLATFYFIFQKKAPERTIQRIVMVCSLIIGVWGTVAVIVRDWNTLPAAYKHATVVSWIRQNVSEKDALCSDPESASFFAAHTGYAVYPAEATLSYAVSNETILHMLETLAGAYDVVGSGSLDMYRFFTDHYRTIPCASASKYSHNAWWYNILLQRGISEVEVNSLIGCRKDVIRRNWERVNSAIQLHEINESAFRALCSWVIIPEEQRQYWNLPKDYYPVINSGGIDLWRGKGQGVE